MIPVQVVGMGMSPSDLPERLLCVIRSAELLVGGRRHLEEFPDHPAEKLVLSKDLDSVIKTVAERAETRQVVVLASGDPGFYGIGARLTRALGPQNLILHPNVTAVQAAFSRAGLHWHDAIAVSLHGRAWERLAEGLNRSLKLAVFTDPNHTPAMIGDFLLDGGFDDARMCVVEDLGTERERVRWFSPAEAADCTGFSGLNMVLVLRSDASAAHPLLHIGMDEDAYDHQRGLITKSEVRAVALARLALGPGQVLWDVGAGCGSVGIEASLLMPGGRVFAIEQDPDRVEQIRANAFRFGAACLEVIEDRAPEAFPSLPDPHRVFIGGGGTGIAGIIEAASERLKPGGRIVVTAVLLETLQHAKMALSGAGLSVDVVQLQVSRGREMAQGTRMQALNPVWILTGRSGG